VSAGNLTKKRRKQKQGETRRKKSKTNSSFPEGADT